MGGGEPRPYKICFFMFNPQIHHRRSIRLKGYDYAQAGAYFVTICCQDRQHRFGKIQNGEMILNELGEIAYREWLNLPTRFPNAELDVFQVMPNHFHAILVLKNVGVGLAPAQTENVPTLGNIIGAYKSLVSKECLPIFQARNEYMGKLWQRDYYEHIIRNENSYQEIANYIINNPITWEQDTFFC